MKHLHLLKLTGLSLLILSLTPVVQAKSPNGPAAPGATAGKEDKAGKRAEKMKEKFDLSDDQIAQLKPLIQSQRQELSALKENTALSKEDKMAQMKAIREKYKPQIAAILTPEQQAKMKEAREQRREKKNCGAAAAPAPAQT